MFFFVDLVVPLEKWVRGGVLDCFFSMCILFDGRHIYTAAAVYPREEHDSFVEVGVNSSSVFTSSAIFRNGQMKFPHILRVEGRHMKRLRLHMKRATTNRKMLVDFRQGAGRESHRAFSSPCRVREYLRITLGDRYILLFGR